MEEKISTGALAKNPNQKGNPLCYLAKRVSMIYQTGPCNNSPLHQAIVANENKLIPILVNQQQLIEVENDLGITPLMASIMTNNLGSFDILLNNGAKPDSPNSRGIYPIDIAITEDNAKAVIKLIGLNISINSKKGDGQYPLVRAVWCHIARKSYTDQRVTAIEPLHSIVKSELIESIARASDIELVKACLELAEKEKSYIVQKTLQNIVDEHTKMVNTMFKPTGISSSMWKLVSATWELCNSVWDRTYYGLSGIVKLTGAFLSLANGGRAGAPGLSKNMAAGLVGSAMEDFKAMVWSNYTPDSSAFGRSIAIQTRINHISGVNYAQEYKNIYNYGVRPVVNNPPAIVQSTSKEARTYYEEKIKEAKQYYNDNVTTKGGVMIAAGTIVVGYAYNKAYDKTCERGLKLITDPFTQKATTLWHDYWTSEEDKRDEDINSKYDRLRDFHKKVNNYLIDDSLMGEKDCAFKILYEFQDGVGLSDETIKQLFIGEKIDISVFEEYLIRAREYSKQEIEDDLSPTGNSVHNIESNRLQIRQQHRQ